MSDPLLSSPSTALPDNPKVSKQTLWRYVVHRTIKGTQLGCAAGLLVALPGLALAPMKFNPDDLPPLIALANISGKVAGLSLAIELPAAIHNCANIDTLYCDRYTLNNREKMLTRVGLCGSIAGLLLEAVRVKEMAKIKQVSVSEQALTSQTLWEFFAMALLGSTVFVGVPTVYRLIKRKYSPPTDPPKEWPEDYQ